MSAPKQDDEATGGRSDSAEVLATTERHYIWDTRHEIDQARTKKQREAMEEYDRTVYYPAKKELYARCEAQGHKAGPIHNNGLGWTFVYCSLCGGVMEKYGPDGG